MSRSWIRLGLSVSLFLAPLGCIHSPGTGPIVAKEDESELGPLRPLTREIAGQNLRSGYLVSAETCGDGPFPKLQIGMRKGYCAGLVASAEQGLKFPRSIVQIPNSDNFVVVDMGGFNPNMGRVLLLESLADGSFRVKPLLADLDSPHGLTVGIDQKIYVGAIDKIFRFDPLAARPESTIEVILQRLPGRALTFVDGSSTESNSHPLKNFMFDKDGNLYVNVGAPSDNCLTRGSDGQPIIPTKPCAAGEGDRPNAALWKFRAPASRVFPALLPNQPNPPFEVYARGLRNSMALAAHPRFPEPGFAFLQGENSRDLSDPSKPNEELNALVQGKHYGWPYCFDTDSESPEYAPFMTKPGPYQKLCSNTAVYQKPYSLLPPHVAPLGMMYYTGARFPELRGKLLMSWHGYMPSGNRVVFYSTDEKGFPVPSQQPLAYRANCDAATSRPIKTDKSATSYGAQHMELIGDWYKVNGIRPQGAPVAMTVARDGAVWVVEDKNQTIIRIDVDKNASNEDQAPLPCDTRAEGDVRQLIDFINNNPENRARLRNLRKGFFEANCMGCHSDFGMRPEMDANQRDSALVRFLLSQDSWIYPGDPASSRIHLRTRALGNEKEMPPGGLDMIKSNPGHRAMLDELDRFIMTMVPGERRRVQLATTPLLKVRDRNKNVCGSVPTGTIVIVMDPQPAEMPKFARIYKPADKHLNGECHGTTDFYVGADYLVQP